MMGVLGGVGFSKSGIFRDADHEEIDTPYGPADMLRIDNIAFIPRHGIRGNIPPHRINHSANIFAFKKEAVNCIIGVNSVGSLKLEIPAPSILIPHDYLALWGIATFFDDEIVHIVPGLDEDLRNTLIIMAEKFGIEVLDRGIYIQTRGPRLETRAEICMLSGFGDVVGMTMANEATLSKEQQLFYASICSVDNYAHGIVDEALTNDIILENAKMNGERIGTFLLKMAGELQ
jgi:5'-methylthioadenosine phosphorylase